MTISASEGRCLDTVGECEVESFSTVSGGEGVKRVPAPPLSICFLLQSWAEKMMHFFFFNADLEVDVV